MSLDIRLKRLDRTYREGDKVSGVVVVTSKSDLSHTGITMVLEGMVNLQLSAKSVGLFDAFYNSLKPVQLIYYSVEVAPSGKLPAGTTEIPFEFPLVPAKGQTLFETYHGVFVNIQYSLKVDMSRPLLAKHLTRVVEFLVEREPSKEKIEMTKVPFTITPDSLENVRKQAGEVPSFKITGELTSATCSVTKPFTGFVTVESCETRIKSIELQLVRVETCGCADGFARDPTEIQNIQIAEGDVCRGLTIPIYMVFPRLFTCPTVGSNNFKVEFEINIVVLLADGYLITENFPIKLVRAGDKVSF